MPTIVAIDHPIILRIAALASEKGAPAYVVGGYVRDALMGRPRTDVDITIVGDALAFAKDVAALFNSKAVVYERFGTAMVPVGDLHVEFVGTRREEYSAESRKPLVTTGTLDDDLRRRDFTVNAMAASLAPEALGHVIDLFDGQADLAAGVLRTPLDPVVTMSDDPLRMMRAARFAAQLGFRIDATTEQAISAMADRIGIISQERITDEFLKVLGAPLPSIGLMVLFRTGLLKHVLPEIHALAGVDLVAVGNKEYRHKDVFLHTLQVVDNVAKVSSNVWLRLATLMHDVAKPKTKRFVEGTGWTFHGHEDLGARWQEKIFRRMKMPMEHLDYVQRLVRLHQRPMMLVDEGVTDSAIRRLAVAAGEALDDLFLLCKADVTTKNPRLAERYTRNYDIVKAKVDAVAERDQLRSFQSPLRGEEIMSITGLPPSRTVGYIKWMIEEAILDGVIPNDFEAAKAHMMMNMEQWIAQADDVRFQRRG